MRKKLISGFLLIMMVSMEVLTPFSYAQESGNHPKRINQNPIQYEVGEYTFVMPDEDTSIFVYTEGNTYTLIFDGNGNTNTDVHMDNLVLNYGESRALPQNLYQKVGYTFIGWNTDKDAQEPYFTDREVVQGLLRENEAEAVLYAIWQPNPDTKYTVEYYWENADDAQYSLKETKILTGTTNDFTNAQPNTYEGLDQYVNIQQTRIAGDESSVVKVYYKRNLYTVTFDSQGAGEVHLAPAKGRTHLNGIRVASEDNDDIVSYKIKYGALLDVPEDPEKQGYHFLNWYPEIPETMPMQNLSFNAEWGANTDTPYQVEHYKENISGNGFVLDSTENKQGTTEELTEAVARNYEGFTLSGNVVQEPIAANGSTVIKLYYKRNSYSVNVVSDRGFLNIDGIRNYKYQEPVVLTPTLKEGYLQKSIGGDFSQNSFTMPAKDVNLTFESVPMSYRITYNLSGGFNDTNPTSYTIESNEITLDQPIKTGYTFVGWQGTDIISTTKLVTIPTGSRGNRSYLAVWMPNVYTVVFNGGDGASGTMNPQYIVYDVPTKLNANTFEKEGQVFSGWKDPNGNSIKNMGEVLNLTTYGEVILTAEWTNPFKVIFKDGNKIISQKGYAPYETIKLPDNPTKDGWRFAGWEGLPRDMKVREDLTITAKWEKLAQTQDNQQTTTASGGGGRPKGNTSNTPDKTIDNEHGAAEEQESTQGTQHVGLSEVESAYQWAYRNSITTLAPLERATPDGVVYRGHMAKMIVNYVVNVMKYQVPDVLPEECKWGDTDWESDEIKQYAEKACALGIMGIDVDLFDSMGVVTRAQFGTILSRLLWGSRYNVSGDGTIPYYQKHLSKLKSSGIMTQIESPEMRLELRKWIWVMLKRTSEKK